MTDRGNVITPTHSDTGEGDNRISIRQAIKTGRNRIKEWKKKVGKAKRAHGFLRSLSKSWEEARDNNDSLWFQNIAQKQLEEIDSECEEIRERVQKLARKVSSQKREIERLRRIRGVRGETRGTGVRQPNNESE